MHSDATLRSNTREAENLLVKLNGRGWMKGKNIYWFSVPCTKESPPDHMTHWALGGVCARSGFAL